MQIAFSKYQGTGNDFVIIDGMSETITLSNHQVAKLCDRKFGIGADGLMILDPSETSDFNMIYYNSDGNLSTMCGNGGRCITSFAHEKGYIELTTTFDAVDGLHRANILENGIVELEMINVDQVDAEGSVFVMNTGSPHYIKFHEDGNSDIVEFGRDIRYSPRFREEGINVNLVNEIEGGIAIKTYERGVENETLSCGTGVTAAAIASTIKSNLRGEQTIAVKAQGGDLYVRLDRVDEKKFVNIWLCGPTEKVFEGTVEL